MQRRSARKSPTRVVRKKAAVESAVVKRATVKPVLEKKRKKPAPKAVMPERVRRAYTAGVLARGEASVADSSGELPSSKTHEIIGYDTTGAPQLKERRKTLI